MVTIAPVVASEEGCTDDGGESGIAQGLAAHDREAATEFGIVAGMRKAIDFAPSHRLPARLRLGLLIAEDILHFFIQFIRSLIDQFEIASLDLRPCLLPQLPSKHSG